MLCEAVRGRTLEEVKKLNRDDVLEMLGIELGPVRLKCGLLALKTLKAGVYGIHQWPGEDEESEGGTPRENRPPRDRPEGEGR
jgi:NifU-like protein involved in Fe-S cluster formation